MEDVGSRVLLGRSDARGYYNCGGEIREKMVAYYENISCNYPIVSLRVSERQEQIISSGIRQVQGP